MNDNHRSPEPPELAHFDENRSKYPPERLLEYAGQHVAWSLDGTRVLASGESMTAVEKKLGAENINPRAVVFDYVDPPV